MPTLTSQKEKVKAISIEYMPTEDELDYGKTLVVGKGLTDRFIRTEDLGYRTFFGLKRFMCGLDVEMIKYNTSLTEAEKEAKIAEVTEIVERLEQFFGKGTLDPTNEKHWSKINLVIDRKTMNLDLTNPRNELIYHCIKDGGFTMVSPTMEGAGDGKAPFYIVEPLEYAENRIANKEVINKAISTLQKIYESKSFDDMFFLAKYILPAEKMYTKRTPKALLYEDLDRYIGAEVVRNSRIAAAKNFIEVSKKAKTDIAIHCLVKDAIYLQFVYLNQAGEFKNNETGGIYGNTIERCSSHLQNPAYENELDNIKTRVEKIWSE